MVWDCQNTGFYMKFASILSAITVVIKLGQMVLIWVNWVFNGKIRSNGIERSQLGTQYKIRSYGLERSQLGTHWYNKVKWSWKESIVYTMIKLGQLVLKGINRVHNDKIRSNGLERSQLGTQCKNQVIWYWKESIGYTMVKLGQMVLKGDPILSLHILLTPF